MSNIKRFERNEKGHDYVVGDIHGCFSKLQDALNDLKFNEETDRLFSVGDLVDRGPESELALDWLAKPWFHAVMGNHEEMAIDCVNDDYDRDTYIYNGGKWFLDLDVDRQIKFVEAFKPLPYFIEVETTVGKIGIVHAELSVDDWNQLDKASLGTATWGRTKITYKDVKPIKNIVAVYVGHTIVPERTVLGNVVYIDTGARNNRPFTIERIT